jgi:ribosome-associated heat shock protein Hsp15
MIAGAQRIDKWLWSARFLKTRTLASKLADAGGVKLIRHGASLRVQKASTLVRAGDELSFTSNERLHVVRVAALAERRGPASEAQRLYEDLTPPEVAAVRAFTKGRRPTKANRRALDRLQHRDEGV